MDLNYQVDINANVNDGKSESRQGSISEKIAKRLNEREAKAKVKREAWASKNPEQAAYLKARGKKITTPAERLAKAGTAVVAGATGAALTNVIKTAAVKKANDRLDKEGVTNKYERDLLNSVVNGAATSASKTIPQSVKTVRGGSRLGAIGQGLIGRVYDKNSEIFVNGLSPEQLSILLKIIPETDMDALHEAIPGSEGHELAYIPVQTLNAMGL